MELKKIKECRDAVNNIKYIDELEDVLKVFNKIRIGCDNMKTIALPNEYTVGWCRRRFEKFIKGCIYILNGRELIKFSPLNEDGLICDKEVIDFILDDILSLNTDSFYKFYFKKYGYETILDEIKSENVKIIFNEFISNHAIMNNIFTLDTYSSVTISGTKRNGTDYEYRLVGCNKADILELVEITRIKPYINKRESYNTDYIRPFVNPYYGIPQSKITESYLEYKRNESIE